MTETTIEERLADIHADMNYERSSLITVGDVANSMVELVDVVGEINDRTKPPTYVVSIDPCKTIRIDDIQKEREVEKLRRKIFDIEVREDLVTTELERQITFLKTELNVAIHLARNLKAERDDLAETNETQAYVIRNRINSFSEGVFAKALEEDVADLEEDNEGLDAELVVWREDALTLRKVVDLVRKWQDHLMANDRVTLNRISHIVGEESR